MKKEFAVLVDHVTEYGNSSYEPVMIEANDILEAMDVAEQKMDETVYLVKILERRAGTETCGGVKRMKFEEVLVNRGHGWKKADVKHSESASTWIRYVSKTYEFWEIASTKWC